MKRKSRLPKNFIPKYGKEKLNELDISIQDVEEKNIIYECGVVDMIVYHMIR